MCEVIEITIDNKLVTEKRDISVYHHASQSAHIISPNSRIILPLGNVGEDDYLHISPVRGPGNLSRDCLIHLPGWVNFRFHSGGDVVVTHEAGRTSIKVPPGPPIWEVEITAPFGLYSPPSQDQCHITISSDDFSPGKKPGAGCGCSKRRVEG
ncbi:MAG: hypothetical protein PVH61_40565 [Candidatus Aminicenantes bacterium]|jgi:hypothetical protein